MTRGVSDLGVDQVQGPLAVRQVFSFAAIRKSVIPDAKVECADLQLPQHQKNSRNSNCYYCHVGSKEAARHHLQVAVESVMVTSVVR